MFVFLLFPFPHVIMSSIFWYTVPFSLSSVVVLLCFSVPFLHVLMFLSSPQLVSELGVLLYRALDFSLASDEERDLSPSLNHLIDLMTSAGELLQASHHPLIVASSITSFLSSFFFISVFRNALLSHHDCFQKP